jgi:hypothetical protein
MFHPIAEQNGWHYAKPFNAYQKVNDRVFVYVTGMMFDAFMVQLYIRGKENMSICQLEARTPKIELLDFMFQLGEEWLKKYSQGDLVLIHKDKYSISNPEGVWGKKADLKEYWINEEEVI